MRKILTRLFWPILKFFETDEESASYKKSHRIVLNIVGALFIFLSLASAVAGYASGQLGSLIPVVVFFCVGSVSVALGVLGSNGAISKIWGMK
ncbi:hypothetical protein [Halomonas sp. BC04]|uniref:hypothetical protein n=1 Tax=Halomonas sp. BC04 TaxID=1403540 RepID=UPI0009DE01C2|nr:hypothetical protein [Halomonas sp. BC04]